MSLHHCRDSNGKLAVHPLEEFYPNAYSRRTTILPQIEETTIASRLDYDAMPFDSMNRDAASETIAAFTCPSTPLSSSFKALDAPMGKPTDRSLGRTDYEHVFIVATEVTVPSQIATYTAIPGAWFGKSNYEVGDPHARHPFEYESKNARNGASIKWIADGLSKTVMLVEKAGQRRWHDTQYGAKTSIDAGGAWIEGERGALAKHPINESNYSGLFAFHPSGAHVVMCDGSAQLLSMGLDVDVLVHLCARSDGQ